MPKMPRIQAIVLPILKDALPGVSVYSWIPDVNNRVFPMVQVRRIGGIRNLKRPNQLSLPVIELTAYTASPDGDLIQTETLYDDALEALYEAVRNQTQTEAGYLHSIKETFGATQFSSLFQDSWRVQGLVQLGLRPPRT